MWRPDLPRLLPEEGKCLKSILSWAEESLYYSFPTCSAPTPPQVNGAHGEDMVVSGKETQLRILKLESNSQLSAICTVTSNKSLSMSSTEFDSMKHVDVSPALGEGSRGASGPSCPEML